MAILYTCVDLWVRQDAAEGGFWRSTRSMESQIRDKLMWPVGFGSSSLMEQVAGTWQETLSRQADSRDLDWCTCSRMALRIRGLR